METLNLRLQVVKQRQGVRAKGKYFFLQDYLDELAK